MRECFVQFVGSKDSLFISTSHSFLSFGPSINLKVLALNLESFLNLIAEKKTVLFCSKPAQLIQSYAKQFRIPRTFTVGQQWRQKLNPPTTFRQLCRTLHDHWGPRGAVFNVQYLGKATLNYSETLENVYLAFNQHIGLTNKKFENLVHLTFNVVGFPILFIFSAF